MISIELRGRLGNQLFQYATCRTLADTLGCDFSIPSDWLGKDIFECDLGIQPYQQQTITFDEGKNSFNESINKIKCGTHLYGFWQTEEYFKHNRMNIKKWFELPISESPYLTEDYCVIHFRAQDGYLREKWVLPHTYFKAAKLYVREKINPSMKFVIVTDNPTLSKTYFPNDIIIHNDIKTDLSILTHSKYKIISNSSFSWWPAWLGLEESKGVIAPNRWINYNKTITEDDIFYPYNIKTNNFIYL